MKLNVYNDPGHGWVAIKRSVLIKLGIEHKITSYSYQRGQTVYLEEDCDASTLISAARDAARRVMPVLPSGLCTSTPTSAAPSAATTISNQPQEHQHDIHIHLRSSNHKSTNPRSNDERRND